MPSVLADVSMTEFDVDDLIDELTERGYKVLSEPEELEHSASADLLRLFELFRTDEAEAIVQTKIFLQDKTGRIL